MYPYEELPNPGRPMKEDRTRGRSEPYSAECLEEGFCELRFLVILRSSEIITNSLRRCKVWRWHLGTLMLLVTNAMTGALEHSGSNSSTCRIGL